jgi:hypothetical protein
MEVSNTDTKRAGFFKIDIALMNSFSQKHVPAAAGALINMPGKSSRTHSQPIWLIG